VVRPIYYLVHRRLKVSRYGASHLSPSLLYCEGPKGSLDPSAVYTKGGALELNLSKVDDPSTNHNLSYKGGMLSTWNKVRLPPRIPS
jgi:hypothetical protein